MLADERYLRILDLLKRDRLVKTDDLIRLFGVSRETIRRDLQRLEEEGLIRRVYGGATLPDCRSYEPPYQSREAAQSSEKRQIALTAAGLVKDGETLCLDVGTTVLQVASQLRARSNLTVVTNSFRVAMALASAPTHRVYVLGGLFRDGECASAGYAAERQLEDFYVDKAIIGAAGLTVEHGVTDYHEPEARVRRIMAERAKEVIVVADHTKFGVVTFVHCLPVARIDKLVTDAKTPRSVLARFEAKGVHVIVAEGEDVTQAAG